MGMLEIRRSSARLNSLGQFRMPELDNGSARAFAAQAEAAKSAAAAARVAGHAAIEGISRRGQIVARTLGDLGKMAVELANRENERIAMNAVLQSENDRNLYMTGDGTPKNPGQFNVRQGKDGEWHAEEWLDDIQKAAEARREKFTANLSGPQKRIYDEMVAKHNVAWNARILAHASKTTLDAQIATATTALGKAKDNAIGNFDVNVARDSSIQAMYDAKESELNVRKVPESLRAAEYKALTESFLVDFAKTKFTAWKNATANIPDAEAVTKLWDEKAKELEKISGKVIDNELVRKYLGSDTLDKARQELLTNEFNAHRAAAIGRAYSLRREGWNAEHLKSLQVEAEIRKNLPPEEPKEREAYFADLAVKYGKLADNKALEPSVALRYREAAVAFAAHAGKEKAAAAKGEIQATENGIGDRRLNLMFAKMNGTISDNDYAEEHAAIWRDFALAWKDGRLGHDFKESFVKDFDKQYDERKLQAMRYVCDLFGYTGKLSSTGEVPQGERTKAETLGTTYKTPFEVDGMLWGKNNPTIGAADLWRVLDSTLRILDTGDKGADPMEQVKKAAMEYKAGWTQKNADGMITASAEAMIRAQQQRVEERTLATMPDQGYGLRNDGKTYKGTGWLGELKLPNGGVATEYTVGVNIDGEEIDIPTLVPTLTEEERELMVNDIIPNQKDVPDAILRKAVAHAKKQRAAGKSVFANDGK